LPDLENLTHPALNPRTGREKRLKQFLGG